MSRSASSPPGSRITSPRSAISTSRGAGRREGTGSALVETVIENLRARGATHLFLNANLQALAFYEKLGFREESRNLVLPLERSLGGRGAFVRLDPRAVGRSRRGRARRPAVRAAAAGRVARKQRHAAAQRLDHGLRRCLRSRPVGAAPPRDRAVGTHGRRRDRDRRRARAGRPLRPASRRDASSTSTSPCRSTTARCRRATRSRSPRTRGSSRDSPAPIPRSFVRSRERLRATATCRPRRSCCEQIAAAIGLEGADHGWEGRLDHALRRRPLPLLRAGADRPRREGHPVRPRRDRPARPPRVAVREEPCRQGARRSRRTAGCFPSRR